MLNKILLRNASILIVVLIVGSVLGVLYYSRLVAPNDAQVAKPKVPSSPYFDYIVVIIMENKNLDQTYGSSCIGDCTYITSLANTFGIAKNYSGVAHGSLPNYMSLTSGANYSYSPWTYNCYGYVQTNGCSSDATNIIDATEKTQRTWRVYFTNDSGCNGQLPFDYYVDFYYNSTRCSQIVDANPGHHKLWNAIPTRLLSDLNGVTAPNLMWLVPNDCDQGYCVKNSTSVIEHSSCGTNSTTFAQCISQANEYLSLVVPRILDSTIFRTQNAVLFITWDEGGGINGFGGICPQRGQTYPTCIDTIPAILAGPHVKPGYLSDAALSHYSFVKTLEVAWNLSPFTPLDADAIPMTDFFAMPLHDSLAQILPLVNWTLADQICGYE